MELSQPVHEVLTVLVRYLALEASVLQEVWRVEVPVLFCPHVDYYLRDELDDRLRISNLKDIVQLKLFLVLLEPVLSPVLHLLVDFLELLLIKRLLLLLLAACDVVPARCCLLASLSTSNLGLRITLNLQRRWLLRLLRRWLRTEHRLQLAYKRTRVLFSQRLSGSALGLGVHVSHLQVRLLADESA